MKQEEILQLLIEELLQMDSLHEEYQLNDNSLVIDLEREDDSTFNIKVKINTDKQEFENWLKNVPDDLFSEVIFQLEGEGLSDLDTIYRSAQYPIIIDKVKSLVKKLAQEKINELQKLID